MTSSSKKDYSTACPYMWCGVQISTDGGSAPCCMAMQQDDPEWRHQSYEDGVHGAKWVEGRELMSQGKWPKICTICKDNEALGIRSARQRALEKDSWHVFKGFDHAPKTSTLDVKYSTKCQLACRMCHPSDSSLIQEQFENKSKYARPHFLRDRWYIPEDTVEQKIEYTKHAIENGLTVLKCTGGEPTASIHYMKLIDWIIENDYQHMLSLDLTTNAVKLSDKFLEKLSQFRRVRFDVSCDGYEASYDYVRWPGKWTTFKTNLEKLVNLRERLGEDRIIIVIATICTIYNVFDVRHIQKMARDYNIHYRLNTALRPLDSELNIDFLHESVVMKLLPLYWYEEKKPIEESWYSIQRKIKDGTPFDHITIDDEKKELYNRLNVAKYNREKHRQFVETTLLLDKQRNQSYKTLHPEIVKYIDAGLHARN